MASKTPLTSGQRPITSSISSGAMFSPVLAANSDNEVTMMCAMSTSPAFSSLSTVHSRPAMSGPTRSIRKSAVPITTASHNPSGLTFELFWVQCAAEEALGELCLRFTRDPLEQQ